MHTGAACVCGGLLTAFVHCGGIDQVCIGDKLASCWLQHRACSLVLAGLAAAVDLPLCTACASCLLPV